MAKRLLMYAELTIKKIKQAKKIFEKNDLFHFTGIKEAMDKTVLNQSCAKAALDIALMDWVGKALNTPLYKMFGLNTSKAPVTSFSIGIDTPEVIKQKVKEANTIESTIVSFSNRVKLTFESHHTFSVSLIYCGS